MKTLFITATDTDAGKTFVARALVRRLVNQGQHVCVFKPVAAGAEYSPKYQQLVNQDAVYLLEESNGKQTYSQVNPVCLAPAIAPHIAAAEADEAILIPQLVDTRDQIARSGCDLLVCEGAGGWLVPLDQTSSMADLAAAFDAEIILVVSMKLGCINHAMLTVEQIKRSGLKLTGWIANTTGEQMSRYQANLAYLTAHIPAPLLAEIPFLGDERATDSVADSIDEAAARFDLATLALG